jgi:hypothetical protein
MLAFHASVVSGSRTRSYPLAAVPSVELGPIRRPLTCPVAELPLRGVDIMIGRDVLHNVAFTLDLQKDLIHFGAAEPFRFRVSFDPSRKSIILPIRIGTHEVSVLLDTGAGALFLFENSVGGWLQHNRLFGLWRRIGHLSENALGTEVRLRDLQLGNATFDSVTAIVLESITKEAMASYEWEGLLGLASLNARRVLFDLRKGIFSWE